MPTLLVATIFMPLVGALLIALSGGGRETARQSALVTTLFTLAMAGALVWNYDPHDMSYAAVQWPWLGPASGIDIQFSVGLDGLSLWLFALSPLLLLTCVLVSWEAIV